MAPKMTSAIKSAISLLAFGTFSGVGAHMVISHPVPFDKGALTNAPLAPDGSDFPCKFGGATGYTSTVTTMNNLAAGENTTLTFMGGATHGGGSCQLSISTDAVPTKDSVWKTIYSIEGGCPTSQGGNVAGDPTNTAIGLNSFDFAIPKSIPNGKVTLAWTWNNHVGNRELYMNCAPVTVKNGASDLTAFNKLPDMEVYNIALNGPACTAPENYDVEYRNPGEMTKMGNGPFIKPECEPHIAGSGAAKKPAAGGYSGSGGSSADSPAAAATSAGGNPGGVFAPGASSAASPSVTTAPQAPAAPPASGPTTMATAATPAASAPAADPPASSGSGNCQAGWQACSTEGVSCLSASKMINCANGCGYVTDLSSTGMSCDGSSGSVQLGYASAVKDKREPSKFARRFPPHARRHAARRDF